jgi:hypothetical protein
VTGRPQRLYFPAFSALVRLGLGVALVVNEGLIRETAQLDVLAAGLGLLLTPEAVKFDRWLSRLRAMAAAEVAAEEEQTTTS